MKTRKMLGISSITTKGFSWYNNGIVSKFLHPGEKIPEGFFSGRLGGRAVCYTNGIENIMINPAKKVIPAGFHVGKIKVQRDKSTYANLAGKKCINNGIMMKFIMKEDSIPNGWKLGRLKSAKRKIQKQQMKGNKNEQSQKRNS